MADYTRDRKKRFGRSFGGRSDRFSSRDFDRQDNRFERRRTGKTRADYEMHKAICSKCGKECELPFKPTTNKPVYCSECFKNPDAPRKESGNKQSISKADVDIINEKLNKIMKALNIE